MWEAEAANTQLSQLPAQYNVPTEKEPHCILMQVGD